MIYNCLRHRCKLIFVSNPFWNLKNKLIKRINKTLTNFFFDLFRREFKPLSHGQRCEQWKYYQLSYLNTRILKGNNEISWVIWLQPKRQILHLHKLVTSLIDFIDLLISPQSLACSWYSLLPRFLVEWKTSSYVKKYFLHKVLLLVLIILTFDFSSLQTEGLVLRTLWWISYGKFQCPRYGYFFCILWRCVWPMPLDSPIKSVPWAGTAHSPRVKKCSV